MKTFNIAVVAIWLVIFGVATTPTNNEMVDWHDNVVYEVNNLFANYVWVAPHNDKGEAIPFASSDTTQFYLRHTFTSLLFFIFALNISFYTGRGDIQQLSSSVAGWLHEKVWRQQILFRYLEYKSKKKSERKEREDTDKYHERRIAEQR